MIRLDKKNFQKLRGLIIERDSELWELYEEYLEVPFPGDAVHIHHVKPRGSGGEDKEDNLIALSPEVHLMHFHTGYGSVVKEYQKKGAGISRKRGGAGMERQSYERAGGYLQNFRRYPSEEDEKRMLAQEEARAAILKENNIICPICHRHMQESMHCPKEKAAVCEHHCENCEYHQRMTPANNGTCLYAKKAPAGTGA